MDTSEAREVIDAEVKALIDTEPTWGSCTDCPNHGKCCDGAPISIWPEEWDPIQRKLHDGSELRQYVRDRFADQTKCYFYDPDASSCLIYDVRPLNCVWTPYMLFRADGDGLSGSLKSHDCQFKKVDPSRKIRQVRPGFPVFQVELTDDEEQVYHSRYILFQEIEGIRGLQLRNEEFRSIDDFLRSYEQLHNKANPADETDAGS